MMPIIFWMITSIENTPDEVQGDVEDQPWQGFSLFLHVLLPIAGLALLWGQRGIFSKLLLQLDRNCVAVYCPSLSKREKLLKWASNRLPSTWSSQARTLSSGIPELWKDGSLLCTLINSVVPGACPNPHRHWRKPPLHAQALAYKYLGLAPMFTEDELCGELTISQEQNFIQYLHKLQEAINKWSTKDETNPKFSSQYVARGMGLYTGEQNRKTVFYIYANATTKKRSNVLMYIRGPYGTQGKATISPFHNLKTIPVVNVLHEQLQATKTLPFKNEEQKSFLRTISLDFTSLISNIEDKQEGNEIPIQIDMEIDRAKITYIPNNNGIYEINLICDGELLRGSPYIVQIVNNTSGNKDSFDSECENIEEKITFTKKKVLSKVIDCIDEKIRIDNDKVLQISQKDDSENSTDDLTITAITKKDDEILKTEINCTLGNIIEEIESSQEKSLSDVTKSELGIEIDKTTKILDEIDEIVEQLDESHIADIDETDSHVKLKVGTQHKLVKDYKEASTEIVNLLQKENADEIDNNIMYNVETKKDVNFPEKDMISNFDIGFIKSSKYIKNIINSTSKQEMLEKISHSKQDENNNSSKQTSLKRVKSKIYLEISPKSPKNITKSKSFPVEVTSPISPEPIVPEVENTLNQLSLAERRKVFSKQKTVSIPDSDDTFFSPENDDTSKRDSSFKELSVLNVLDSLKDSRQDCGKKSLSSAVSLPNISTSDENINEFNFKERKDYWEKLSSCSSSNVSLANSDFGKQKRTPSVRSIEKWNPQKENCKDSNTAEKNAFEIKVINFKEITQSKSMDTSLEDCTLIPLEERKKQLLKNMYEQEKIPTKKINVNLSFFKKPQKPKVEKKETFFPPISDRIQTINNFTDRIQSTESHNLAKIPTNNKSEPKKISTKHKIKSQFRKAINFFKNLEESSKLKERNKNLIKRSYSLDGQKKNNSKQRRCSLNLPNVSDRFSISNLYEDIIGSKRGSFRGSPNRIGVTNSLASFPKGLEPKDLLNQDENSISYNLFLNKAKTKKRRSIKSLFDVSY